MSDPSPAQALAQIYRLRFEKNQAYRKKVWRVLISRFFQRFVRLEDTVLDLGCGYGEFINQIECAVKYGMDLNPEARSYLGPNVQFLHQDCAESWALPDRSLDVIFTSNFFEHLPSKLVLGKTLAQAHRCLKPGGKLIALGPNIKCVPGAYWDFWDHELPLTELSLSEGLRNCSFEIQSCLPRFLPFTIVNTPKYPVFFVRLYVALPFFWKIFGRQFLVVAVAR